MVAGRDSLAENDAPYFSGLIMILSDILSTLSARLSALWPETPGLLKQDLEKNIRSVLEGVFNRLDLVTREEFDIQTRVLARCRERIVALEKIIESMEAGKPS